MAKASSSSNRYMRHALTLIVCALVSLAVILNVSGKPFRLGRLPDGGRNFGCLTCHVAPGGPRNPFGQDYEELAISAGDKYTVALGKMDSDGDGFANDEEFAANTHPGKPESAPEAKIDTQKEQDKGIQVNAYLYEAGRLLALVGFMLILVQYVLSSRVRLIERSVGLDKLFLIHRKTGVLGLAFSIPNALMFTFFARGGIFIYESSLVLACLGAGVSILLVAWFLYVIISVCRGSR